METLTNTDRSTMNKALEQFADVAREIVREAKQSTTHGKDGYILVTNILEAYTAHKNTQKLLIVAILRAGYPTDTMQHICTIEGIV